MGNEVEAGRTWAESKIKALTGGDRLQGRFMRQDFFEFDPQFKLMVAGNHKPSLRGVDEAIRRRLHLIPFTVTIPPDERDPDLPEKLKAEWPAILRWAIDGCLDWQQRGARPARSPCATPPIPTSPPRTCSSTGATSARRRTATRGRAAPTFGPRGRHGPSAAGEFVGTQRAFSNKLLDHGLTPKSTPARGYLGLAINRPSYSDENRYGS